MIEAGYRCAVCRATEPLDIDHIIEWSTVGRHSFENMIVLCKNCHGRKKKGNNPRDLNHLSLKKIKSNLMMLNGRYSDIERRIIEDSKKEILEGVEVSKKCLSGDWRILTSFLKQDGFFEVTFKPAVANRRVDGVTLTLEHTTLDLTPEGRRFIEGLTEPELGQQKKLDSHPITPSEWTEGLRPSPPR
ncbi:MAG: HNH endonuclease signature motif containing protein [Rhodomicrobium sp.]